MKTYARMIDGRVAQIVSAIFDSNGQETPLDARFDAGIVAQFVEYDPLQRPEHPAPTHDELVEFAKADMRARRQPILSVLDGLQASALALGNTTTAQLIEQAKQALRDITTIDLSACVTYEDMRLAVMARYLQLVAAASPDVRAAFSEALK